MIATQPLNLQYGDLDGSPLDGGYLYFGTINLNPETNPITVYWDAAGTQPAAQPIRTESGYPVRNGAIAQVFAPTNYSLTVRNRSNVLVYSEPTSATSVIGFVLTLAASAGSTLIGFIQAGVGAVLRTLQDKGRERVSVLDFGAVCDSGVTNNTPLVQAAQDYCELTGKALYFPAGDDPTTWYGFDSPVIMQIGTKWFGDGITNTWLRSGNNNSGVLEMDSGGVAQCTRAHFSDMQFTGTGALHTTWGVHLVDASRNQFERVRIAGFNTGVLLEGGSTGSAQSSYLNTFRNCSVDNNNTIGIDARRATNLLAIYDGEYGGNDIAVSVVDSANLRIRDADFEENITTDIEIDQQANDAIGFNFQALIDGCSFENSLAGTHPVTHIKIGASNTVNGVVVNAPSFLGDAATIGIDALNVAALTVINPQSYRSVTDDIVQIGNVRGLTIIQPTHSISQAIAHNIATLGLSIYSGLVNARLAANQDFTTAVMTDVTGFSFPIGANEEWIVEMDLSIGAGLATTGIIYAIFGPAGATLQTDITHIQFTQDITQTNLLISSTLNGNLDFTTAMQANATNAMARVTCWMKAGATAGTFQLKAANSAAVATVTIRKGSQMRARRVV